MQIKSDKFHRHRDNMRKLIINKDESLVYRDIDNDDVIATHTLYGSWVYRKSDVKLRNLQCTNEDKYVQSTPPNDDWESTMTKDEVDFILGEISKVLKSDPDYYGCEDSFRGARIWKKSQRKRFKRLRSCCGSYENIVKRFNNDTQRWDKYWIGFNYGH